MAMFIPDTDPELRSRLAACHAADDLSAPLEALAAWLDLRHDPRAAMVRLGMNFWQATHWEPERQSGAEFDELERRMDDEGPDVLMSWLGFVGNGDTLGVSWHGPLPSVYVNAFEQI